jgi:cold shock CspA family protein
MLWFNADKGFGFILTADAERLYVSRSGFAQGTLPKPRCAGHSVTFERSVGEGPTCAVNVEFPTEAPARRARLRYSR